LQSGDHDALDSPATASDLPSGIYGERGDKNGPWDISTKTTAAAMNQCHKHGEIGKTSVSIEIPKNAEDAPQKQWKLDQE
jgi:hypothetical protein